MANSFIHRTHEYSMNSFPTMRLVSGKFPLSPEMENRI